MVTLTPQLCATPGNPLTYNPSVADTFSWIPIDNNANRPIFARAMYLTNASDINVSLSASDLNVNVADIETLLCDLTATNKQVPGFSVPPYDEVNLTYYGTTNNIKETIYKNSSTIVYSLSFEYIPNPPLVNNAKLSLVKKY